MTFAPTTPTPPPPSPRPKWIGSTYNTLEADHCFFHLHISYNKPCLPPKIFHTFAFLFSWVLLSPQEKLKTMLMHNFLGANKVYYRRCAINDE